MKHPSLRPLIGVTACFKDNGRGGFQHTVGDKYVQAALQAAGGLPVLIPAIGPQLGDEPAMTAALDRLLDALDGVLLTGSPSNVEPHRYGGAASRDGTEHDPARDATTLPLIRHCLDRGVPLFAICRGLQEVNVALGGTLHQLVHEVDGRRDHRSPKSPDNDVNYGPAHAIDLVEAFSVPAAPGFALALQWHPEYKALENPVSMKLFDAFSAACRARAEARLAAPPIRVAAE